VNTTTAGEQDAPKVAVLGSGGAAMVWQTTPDAGEGVIHTRFLKPNGTFASEQEVTTVAEGSHTNPAVLRSTSDRVVIVWQAFADDHYSIYARRYDSLGVAIDNVEFKVNTQDVSDHQNAGGSFVTDGETGFGLVWDGRGPLDGQGIYLSLYDWAQDGALTKGNEGVDLLINSQPSGGQYRPAIGASAAGSFLVAWDRDPLIIHETVMVRQYKADGSADSEPVEIVSNGNAPARYPSVTALGDLGYVVVWESGDDEVAGTDDDGSAISMRVLDAAGQPVAEEESVVNATVAGNQTEPVVAGNSAGQYVVVWSSQGMDSSGTAVVMQRFTTDGPLGDEITVNIFELGDQGAPSAYLTDSGNITVLFTATTEQTEGKDIFGAMFNWDGGRLMF